MNESGAFFDSFADTFDTFYDGQRRPVKQWIDRRFRSDMFLRFKTTFDALGDIRGRHIVDIGCGSGPYVAECLERGAAHVTGIDPAPRMLELADARVRKLGLSNDVTWLEGYFPQVTPGSPFDDAIVMGVLDYVDRPVAFVGALDASIGGRAVLSFPSTHWFRTPFRQLRYKVRRCPVHFFTRAAIERVMRDAGVRRYAIEKIPGAGMDYVAVIEK